MQRFNNRFTTDEGFRDFINTTNLDEVLYDFGYHLFLHFGANTVELVSHWVNPKVIDIENLISYFEKEGEFEKCTKLIEIKKKIK